MNMGEENMFFVDLQDKRNYYAKEIIAEKHAVKPLEEYKSEIKQGDVILYSPAKQFDLNEALSLPRGITVYAGNVCEQILKIFKEKYIIVKNFLQDEKFAIENAKLTAEGVLAIIIENTPKSLKESKILILGGGRISKALAVLLNKMDVFCAVTSFTKSEYHNAFYYSSEQYFGKEYVKKVGLYDVIVNTRPQFYVGKEVIDKIKKNALFIETASVECLNEHEVKNFNYFLAPKLPQKFCPQSAGRIIAEKVLEDTDD